MKGKLLSLVLVLSLALTACSGGTAALKPRTSPPPAAASAQPALDAALGEFGLNLLREVRTPGENTFLSPLSVLLCLSMAANGAAGNTAAQFQDLLAGGADLEALNANCASLLTDYAALENGTELSIADSLWLDRRVRAEDAFVGRCTGTYQAGVFAADFTQDRTRGDINRWIKQNTGGHIENALSEIDPETVLALVNAVYFEGKWQDEFDPGDTMERPFYGTGATADRDFMCSGGRSDLYVGTETAGGVLLPYRDGRLALLALMPGEGHTLEDLLDDLDGEALADLIAGREETWLRLYLPKFEVMWKDSLLEPLAALGLTDALDPLLADFSPMGTDEDGNPLYLSTVIHGAGVEVDEQGARAFAFTFGGMSGGAAAPPETLIFDRPFLYGIVDLERGVPLFLGTFEDP